MRTLTLLFLLCPSLLAAQIGGSKLFDFLNLSPSARISALGGTQVAMCDEDGTFALQNPALLSDSADGFLNLNVYNYLSDIGYGNVSYVRQMGQAGTFHGGLQYVNYGTFNQRDEYGNYLGNYRSGEMALIVGGSRTYKENFAYGLNLKLIQASYAGYNAWAGALDFGGRYRSDDGLFCAGVVVRNMGAQFSKFTQTGNREPLPTQVQAGISYKLKYMPMRYYITAIHLQQPNLIYTDPNAPVEVDFNGNPIPTPKRIGDKIVAHFVFGTEFLLGKNLRLRAGYNHLRRIELRSSGRAGLSGFTMGGGIRISKFRFDYAFVRYAAGMNTHQFSLSTNLRAWRKG